MDISDYIMIDYKEPIIYGEVYAGDHPRPSVRFSLIEIPYLHDLANNLRAENGYAPLCGVADYYWELEFSEEGTWLMFTVLSHEKERYMITLTENDKLEIRTVVDHQCQYFFGRTLEGILNN